MSKHSPFPNASYYEEELKTWVNGDGYFDADQVVSYIRMILRLLEENKALVERLEELDDRPDC